MTRNMENRPGVYQGGQETTGGSFFTDDHNLDTDKRLELGLVGAVLSTDSVNARRVLSDLTDEDIQHKPAKMILNALRTALAANPAMSYEARTSTGAMVAYSQLIIDPGEDDPSWRQLSPWLTESVSTRDPAMADWYADRVKARAARRRVYHQAAGVRSALRDDPAAARGALNELWSTARRDLPSIERGDLT